MAKPKSRSGRSSRSNALLLLLLIVGSAIIAGLFFQDYREVPYGWFLTALWLVVAAFSCAFGIIYYAQFVLPHHAGENWLEGIAMMLRAATQSGSPPSTPSTEKERLNDSTGRTSLNPSFWTLKAGMVPSHQVVALAKGDGYARAAGPGFVRFQPGEWPAQVIDLRKHLRSAEASANTRDGIPLICKVSVAFQIKQSAQDHEGDALEYPYARSAVFWASQLNTFDQDDVIRTWSEQIAPQAATFMISEIAQFTLDEIWQDPTIFSGIQQRIRHQLRSGFDEWGIKILNVKVTPQELPEQIGAQRLENWKAMLQSQMQAQAAAGNAEAMRRIKMARARAQIEIIEQIMQSIEEMRQAQGGTLPEIVTLRIIDVLEDAATKNASQTYLPSQIMDDMPPDFASGQSVTQQDPTSVEVDQSDS